MAAASISATGTASGYQGWTYLTLFCLLPCLFCVLPFVIPFAIAPDLGYQAVNVWLSITFGALACLVLPHIFLLYKVHDKQWTEVRTDGSSSVLLDVRHASARRPPHDTCRMPNRSCSPLTALALSTQGGV